MFPWLSRFPYYWGGDQIEYIYAGTNRFEVPLKLSGYEALIYKPRPAMKMRMKNAKKGRKWLADCLIRFCLTEIYQFRFALTTISRSMNRRQKAKYAVNVVLVQCPLTSSHWSLFVPLDSWAWGWLRPINPLHALHRLYRFYICPLDTHLNARSAILRGGLRSRPGLRPTAWVLGQLPQNWKARLVMRL